MTRKLHSLMNIRNNTRRSLCPSAMIYRHIFSFFSRALNWWYPLYYFFLRAQWWKCWVKFCEMSFTLLCFVCFTPWQHHSKQAHPVPWECTRCVSTMTKTNLKWYQILNFLNLFLCAVIAIFICKSQQNIFSG